MPLVFGPKNSRYTYTGSPCPHSDLAFHSDAETLNAALREYEAHFGVTIVPHVDAKDAIEKFGEKYFLHTDNASGVSQLVDIHVIRGGEELCIKQDVSFALKATDLVEMGDLIC
ncbi:hypothetical protein PQH03_15920 [Ralstonia insidiosa]|jgi:hypothetical protein|uniref:hypothetical protein n=1 Tax=Ralstonia TaxID=48736 RepID=UPI000664A047|nr:hypothetical protein [Ralstonia insidiosa]KMW44486.1 hypothetical protein AC240_24640 [Ralstonia sp. MD27]KMY65387.1 hypothetical protein AAU61_22520 [Desulfocarbo indianensis]MBX3773324.1 hypothetical protein [Ralstonia pickettii]NOZ15076.1 hypothetical protein [Betaproteobacteria bacterium]MBA9858425.1 hypothetical protein [Ralstonia insidiosa]